MTLYLSVDTFTYGRWNHDSVRSDCLVVGGSLGYGRFDMLIPVHAGTDRDERLTQAFESFVLEMERVCRERIDIPADEAHVGDEGEYRPR